MRLESVGEWIFAEDGEGRPRGTSPTASPQISIAVCIFEMKINHFSFLSLFLIGQT